MSSDYNPTTSVVKSRLLNQGTSLISAATTIVTVMAILGCHTSKLHEEVVYIPMIYTPVTMLSAAKSVSMDSWCAPCV